MLFILPSWLAMATTARPPGTRVKAKIKHKQFTTTWPPILILSAAVLALTQPNNSIADTQNIDFGRYSERLARCKVSTNPASVINSERRRFGQFWVFEPISRR